MSVINLSEYIPVSEPLRDVSNRVPVITCTLRTRKKNTLPPILASSSHNRSNDMYVPLARNG